MKLYSNEIVFRGHPDKVCDQISDALLDAFLSGDSSSRCGIEVMGGKGRIFITGEVTSATKVNVESVVMRVLKEVGYINGDNAENLTPSGTLADFKIVNNLGVQSQDIALGTNDEVGGAGDQGMMFGFACDDNAEYKPTAMVIMQEFSKFYDELRQKDSRFLADGKTQLTGEYDDNMRLAKIKDWTISYQNTETDRAETDQILIDKAREIAGKYGVEVEKFLVNPTGKFLIGGFMGDAGLTGRKIVVDSYQSFAQLAVVPSRVRIHPRWIVPLPIRHAKLPWITSSVIIYILVKCNFPTPLALPSHSRFTSMVMVKISHQSQNYMPPVRRKISSKIWISYIKNTKIPPNSVISKNQKNTKTLPSSVISKTQKELRFGVLF